MELGMIGLGRMGANMTERLVLGGHRVVSYDRSAKTIPLQPKSPTCCATSSAATPLKKGRPQWRAIRTTTCPKV